MTEHRYIIDMLFPIFLFSFPPFCLYLHLSLFLHDNDSLLLYQSIYPFYLTLPTPLCLPPRSLLSLPPSLPPCLTLPTSTCLSVNILSVNVSFFLFICISICIFDFLFVFVAAFQIFISIRFPASISIFLSDTLVYHRGLQNRVRSIHLWPEGCSKVSLPCAGRHRISSQWVVALCSNYLFCCLFM